MFGNACDGGKLGSLRMVGKISKFHCSDHFLTQLCHDIPPLLWVNNHLEVFYTIGGKRNGSLEGCWMVGTKF